MRLSGVGFISLDIKSSELIEEEREEFMYSSELLAAALGAAGSSVWLSFGGVGGYPVE